jgi:hypothetical protein
MDGGPSQAGDAEADRLLKRTADSKRRLIASTARQPTQLLPPWGIDDGKFYVGRVVERKTLVWADPLWRIRRTLPQVHSRVSKHTTRCSLERRGRPGYKLCPKIVALK